MYKTGRFTTTNGGKIGAVVHSDKAPRINEPVLLKSQKGDTFRKEISHVFGLMKSREGWLCELKQ